jgi:phage tail-like protein
MGWSFRGAIATKWIGPELNANQSAVAIDGLEVAHEGLEAVPLTDPGDVAQGGAPLLR